MRRVAIIGAGPAGLMAAEAALARGARVALYDAMPSPRIVLRLAATLLLASVVVPARATGLPAAFIDALQQARIPLDHVAVVVQDLAASEPVLAHNAEAAMNPASVMKLVTS
ncbi:MAG: hypothetical protein B7Z22_13540, partial [Hyphomonas sp. 32-62-5]